jgi:hypothetical protein
MTAVVVLLAFVLAIVVALLIGLLRAHAEILQALHDLGAGRDPRDGHVHGPGRASTAGDASELAERVAEGVAPPRAAGIGTHTPAITGVTPHGSAIQVAPDLPGRLTLLAFLSTGCSTCADFWRAWRDGELVSIDGVGEPRPVIVTKGPEHEHVAAVGTLAPERVTTVMSSEAWAAYAVPASPYFVLVDGDRGVIGEGSAASFTQLRGVLERATSDVERENEVRIDRELLNAGITPGHESLYDWKAASGQE